jgi:hypothetical protein
MAVPAAVGLAGGHHRTGRSSASRWAEEVRRAAFFELDLDLGDPNGGSKLSGLREFRQVDARPVPSRAERNRPPLEVRREAQRQPPPFAWRSIPRRADGRA